MILYVYVLLVEITVKKRKWMVHTVYRPPSSDSALFFNELSKVLDHSFGKYENLLILGDLNIDLNGQTKIPKPKKEFLHELYDTYDLYNLISESTCITRTCESIIDLILTNCSRSLMYSKTIESGLSDFHEMTTTMMRCTYTRQEPVKITYRDYTKFSKEKFISQFRAKKLKFKGHTLNTNTAYNNLIETLKEMLSVHPPIKRRLVRGNQAQFMNNKSLGGFHLARQNLMKLTVLSLMRIVMIRQ